MKYTKQQQARIDNALAIGRRIQEKLAAGWLVFDDDGERVHRIELEMDGFPAVVSVHDRSRTFYFQADPEMDHGLYETIKQFNERFTGWLMAPASAYQAVVTNPKRSQAA
jgi:hypothetical protein